MEIVDTEELFTAEDAGEIPDDTDEGLGPDDDDPIVTDEEVAEEEDEH